jgi:hypothetical protein
MSQFRSFKIHLVRNEDSRREMQQEFQAARR